MATKMEIKWAEITVGKTTKRYTVGVDADSMGFDPATGAFIVELKDGTGIDSWWNTPIRLHQEEVPDIVVPEIAGQS